jgi:hypothetical protein
MFRSYYSDFCRNNKPCICLSRAHVADVFRSSETSANCFSQKPPLFTEATEAGGATRTPARRHSQQYLHQTTHFRGGLTMERELNSAEVERLS